VSIEAIDSVVLMVMKALLGEVLGRALQLGLFYVRNLLFFNGINKAPICGGFCMKKIHE
jgi:hypothetical protein